MIKHAVLSAIRRLGYDLVLFNNTESERQHLEIYERVRPYLLSSYERTYALIDATRYIVRTIFLARSWSAAFSRADR